MNEIIPVLVVSLPVALLIVALGVRNWRTAIFALLLFLPFAAVPGIVLQARGWPTLLKDVLFVVPAYLGFLFTSGRRVWLPPRSMMLALVPLLVVLGIQSVNTLLKQQPLVMLVGLKVWPFYMPLIVLGRNLFRDQEQAMRWMRWLVIVALVPASIGLLEAVLVNTSEQGANFVYGLYGSLAPDVTQGFVTLPTVTEEITLRRIPSTFYFVGQYYQYLFALTPIAMAVALARSRLRWRILGICATLLLAMAGFFSGARGYIAWFPVQLLLMLMLSVPRRFRNGGLIALGVAGLILVGTLALHPKDQPTIVGLVADYAGPTLVRQMSEPIERVGWLGAGVGTQTNAARYVVDEGDVHRVEVWYAKILYELGIVGLVLVLVLWAAVVYELWRARAQLSGSVKVLASGVFVAVLTAMANLLKAEFIELDPFNVLFWIYIGVGIALPALPARRPADAVRAREEVVSGGKTHVPRPPA